MLSTSEPLEAVITWPANANGAQRYVTRKCFYDAGFEVIDTLNEPTAAAIELADCLTAAVGRKARTNHMPWLFSTSGAAPSMLPWSGSMVKISGTFLRGNRRIRW